MWPNNLRVVLFILMAVFLVGCKKVVIDSPKEAQAYAAAPEFKVSFPDGKPPKLKLKLNGNDVTGQFSVQDTGATAAGAALANALVDGENLFEVAEPVGPKVRFFIDKSGPEIHITDVNGTRITGYLKDLSGASSLTINGASVSLNADGSFVGNLPSVNIYTFIAKDKQGQSNQKVFANPRFKLSKAVGARVEQAGIDFFVKEITDRIVGENLNALIAGRVLKGTLIPLVNYEVRINSGSLGKNASMKLDVVNNASKGQFRIAGQLPQLVLDLEIELKSGFISVKALDGVVTTDVESFASDVYATVASGGFNIALSNLAVELEDLVFDVDLGLIGKIPGLNWSASRIVSFFANILENLIEPIIAGQLEKVLPEQIAQIIDVIPKSIEVVVLGKRIKPSFEPETIVSPNRGLELGLGTLIYAPDRKHQAVGSLYKATGAFPPLTTTTPRGDTNHVGGVVSNDVVNQALVAAFESGLLNMSVDQSLLGTVLGTGDESLGNGDEFRLDIKAFSPPTIEFVNSTSALGLYDIKDFYFDFFLKRKGQGSFAKIFGASVDFSTKADLNIEKGVVVVDGKETQVDVLKIGLEGTPVIIINKVNKEGAINWSEAFINRLIKTFTPTIAPQIVKAIAVPVPSFEGYSLKVGDLWVPNGNTDFVSYAADLIRVAKTASAPAPVTYANIVEGPATASRSVSVSEKYDDNHSVVIHLSGYNPEDEPLEYRYRVNQSTWSLWKKRDEINVTSLRSGLHNVEVCSRTSMLKEETNCPVLEVNVR